MPSLGANAERVSLNSCEADLFELSADGTKLVRENGKTTMMLPK